MQPMPVHLGMYVTDAEIGDVIYPFRHGEMTLQLIWRGTMGRIGSMMKGITRLKFERSF